MFSTLTLRLLAANLVFCAFVSQGASAQQLDTTAPTLTGFSLNGSVNLDNANSFVSVTLKIRDNLSGVYDYQITLESPGKNSIIKQEGLSPTLATTFNTTVQVGYLRYENVESNELFNRQFEPGVWSVTQVFVRDLAGNSRTYDKAALALLGNTDFTVTKNDKVPPVVLGGVIKTPIISLSTPPLGTPAGTLPFAKASLTMQDTGSAKPSGIDIYSVFFCLPPFNPVTQKCADFFGLIGLTGKPIRILTTAQANGMLESSYGTVLRTPVTPGVYEMHSVDVQDLSGNTGQYLAPQFGGSADLDTLFPDGTTITVTP
jgi:hypothetical protein